MEKRFGPLLFIPGENNGNYPCCHSLYLECGIKVVIDPASDRNRLRNIRDTSGVDAVWLSHWHEDHFTHLDLFDERELWLPELDYIPLRSLENFFDAYGMNDEERAPWTKTLIDDFHFKPRTASRLVKTAECVDLGGMTVEVIHTPGHTPGHTSLYFRDIDILFLGDYDLTAFGPWYGDTCSDIDQTLESIKKLSEIDARVWITSHGAGIHQSVTKADWDDYASVIKLRDEKLSDFLRQPRTMADIIEERIVYRKKREPKEFYDFGERSIMRKHLERFIKTGAATFDGQCYHMIS